jgi:hypothetical protein
MALGHNTRLCAAQQVNYHPKMRLLLMLNICIHHLADAVRRLLRAFTQGLGKTILIDS